MNQDGTINNPSKSQPNSQESVAEPALPSVAVQECPDKSRTSYLALVIAELTLTPFMNSFSTGLMTVAIPTMARDLGLPPQSYYWPISVYGITASSLLLLSGSVADVVGSKRVYLVALFFLSLFILASGLAQTVRSAVTGVIDAVSQSVHQERTDQVP